MKKGQPQHRSAVEFKSKKTIGFQKRCKPFPLVRLGEGTGVLDHERHEDFGRDFLLRLFKPLPNKARAQHVVPLGQPLPGSFQPAGVNLLWQIDHQLLDVNAGVRFHEVMKQHPLLHRGEWKAIHN